MWVPLLNCGLGAVSYTHLDVYKRQVIVVSGNAQEALETRAFTEDITDYFDKSLGQEALAAFIRCYVQPAPIDGAREMCIRDRVQAVAQSLQQRGDVTSIATISPEQALASMRERDDLAAAIDILGTDAARAALPPVLQVTPRGDASALVRSVQALPETDRVQFDTQWRDRRQAWLALSLIHI